MAELLLHKVEVCRLYRVVDLLIQSAPNQVDVKWTQALHGCAVDQRHCLDLLLVIICVSVDHVAPLKIKQLGLLFGQHHFGQVIYLADSFSYVDHVEIASHLLEAIAFQLLVPLKLLQALVATLLLPTVGKLLDNLIKVITILGLSEAAQFV